MQICAYLFIHSLYLLPIFHLFINYLAVRQFLPSLNTQTSRTLEITQLSALIWAGGLDLQPFTNDDTTHQKCGPARFSVPNPRIWPWWSLPTSQGSPLTLALSPPSLTVAWKNNCTWKTIKTILPKFLKMDSQLLASFHRLRCGENMTCRKILKSLLFIGAKEWVFN